jgi:hypothetical protein
MCYPRKREEVYNQAAIVYNQVNTETGSSVPCRMWSTCDEE